MVTSADHTGRLSPLCSGPSWSALPPPITPTEAAGAPDRAAASCTRRVATRPPGLFGRTRAAHRQGAAPRSMIQGVLAPPVEHQLEMIMHISSGAWDLPRCHRVLEHRLHDDVRMYDEGTNAVAWWCAATHSSQQRRSRDTLERTVSSPSSSGGAPRARPLTRACRRLRRARRGPASVRAPAGPGTTRPAPIRSSADPPTTELRDVEALLGLIGHPVEHPRGSARREPWIDRATLVQASLSPSPRRNVWYLARAGRWISSNASRNSVCSQRALLALVLLADKATQA